MTQSFDELARFHGLSLMKWDEDNYASENTQLANVFFEEGQKAKQDEIDELQNKYDAMYRAFTVADDCRKEWHRCCVNIQQREDRLQKLVDEIRNHVEISYDENRDDDNHAYWSGYNQALRELFEILK